MVLETLGGMTTSTSGADQKTKQHGFQKLTDKMLESMLPGNGQYLLTFLSKCDVLPFEDFKVYKSSDYGAFSHLAENRDLNEQHVHTLMESFENDGYLFTILYVNEKMQIIDGQHRFEAAKRKHLPVYFIIMPGWDIRHVAILNVNSRNWTMADFMNTHAKAGNENYIRFKQFYDEHDFDITTAQLVVLGRRTKLRGDGGGNDDFRSGQIKISQEQINKAYVKARKIKELKDFHPHGWKSGNCVTAMLALFNTKGYDHSHFITQLKKYPITILMDAKSLRTKEYLDMFIEKYNYRKKDKIELP